MQKQNLTRRVVITIEPIPQEKVVLLPKTIEFYSVELTKMLETERYIEAIKLLQFLIGCKGGDPQTEQEWQNLLDWLLTMFPEGRFTDSDSMQSIEEEEASSEQELFRELVKEKEGQDSGYANKLLAMLQNGAAPEKQMLALEQLIYIEKAEVDDALKQWLQKEKLPPYVQFKGLQALKARGCRGPLQITKLGVPITVELEDTPADFDLFPGSITEIKDRIQEISEVSEPSLSYFAGQMWNEFLAYIYGTSVYYQILKQPDEALDTWAAALHYVLVKMMMQTPDIQEIHQMYGITSQESFYWEQALRTMDQFAKSFIPIQ